MAEPIRYEVPPEDSAQSRREQAYAELDRLVLLLHEHQVLRLACDSTAALADVGQIVTHELDTVSGKQTIENLYVLMRILGRIPPQKLERAVEAAGEAFAQMEDSTTDDKPYPPGISGTYNLLRDQELWQALGPALEGLKAFAAHVQYRE